MSEEIIGMVVDFFAHPVVAGIELTGALKIGEIIGAIHHTLPDEIYGQPRGVAPTF